VYDADVVNSCKGKVMKKGMGRMKVKEQETVVMMMMVIL
jgi:hypothetical protein